jgi:NAD kinase
MPGEFIPQHPVIAAYPKVPQAFTEAEAMSSYLKEKGIDAPFGSLYDEDLRKRVRRGEFDLLIMAGGDGSVLRAGNLCASSSVPILGVNLGRIGFLIQVEVSADVDGRHLTSYVADGLIASTATGSTAYALAAGGPILPPELRNILLVPIAPHLSVDRAVVLSEGSMVTIRVNGENAVMSVDGQPSITLMEDDRITVHAAEVTTKFVRFGDPGYFYRNITAHMNENSLGLPR